MTTPRNPFEPFRLTRPTFADALAEAEIRRRLDTPPVTESPSPPPPQKKRVFVAFGRDEKILAQVEAFLLRSECNPIILRNKSIPSQLLIDEFVKNAVNLSFAVVIMTGDDVGRLNVNYSQTMLRARQNVLFEFGYLVHLLKRNKVFVLHEGGVEMPSDLAGLIYIPYDEAGAWRLELVKAVRAAKIGIYSRWLTE